jgi:short-subunit dehydrogenase
VGTFDFTAGTAVVTGAANGIGEQLAYALARRGSALALVDRDTDRLEKVAWFAQQVADGPVASYVTDLADDAAARRLAEDLAAAHPDTRLLVNNAGVALGGAFEEVSADEFDWLLAINLRAVVTMTRGLLPVLLANAGSHLVNLSSLFGLIAPAGQVAYSTSKFAVRGFSEGLRAELAGRVGVTVVHPGGIRTRIAQSARIAGAAPAATADTWQGVYARTLTFPPERAAELIVTAIEQRHPRLLIGADARVLDLLPRLSPAGYVRLLARLQRLTTGNG